MYMFVASVILILSSLSQDIMYILSMEKLNLTINLCTHHHSLVHCVTCVPVPVQVIVRKWIVLSKTGIRGASGK